MENTIQQLVKRGRFRSLNDMWIRMRRNKLSMVGLTVILLLIIVAIFADQIAPYGFAEQDLANQFAKPSSEHLFGTDDLGRDIFSRVVYGSRISLKVGFISVGIALVLGVAIGAITGYFGGRIDNILMRFIDILQSIPDILLAIAILAALGPGLSNLMIAVGVAAFPGTRGLFARPYCPFEIWSLSKRREQTDPLTLGLSLSTRSRTAWRRSLYKLLWESRMP